MKSPSENSADLVFLPLGGTGEIGMNCNLYGYGTKHKRDWLMVDLGVVFGDQQTPGVDLIMPDIEYIVRHKKRLLGLVLTHGHADHIGAVAHLWPYLECPIYASRFTANLLRDQLRRQRVCADGALRELEMNQSLELGAFAMEFCPLTHSIPEMQAIAIRTPVGNILHTGDWKLDPEPLVGERSHKAMLKSLADEDIAAVVCDSTNALEEGHSGSEANVRDALRDAVGACKGRVVMTGFASNVARLDSMGAAAAAHGRQVVLMGRGMHTIYKVARQSGYLQDFPPLLEETAAARLAPNKVAVLCTGSQGEPMAALSRFARGGTKHLRLEKNDTVIFSSRVIPGNEAAVGDLQNRLLSLGVAVQQERDLHVSGHPCRDELRSLYRWVRPRASIPVHGERRHLQAHCALARDCGVPQAIEASNGDVVRLAPGAPAIVERVAHGRLHLDGNMLVREDESPALQRYKVAQSGLVSLYLTLDEDGRVLGRPILRLLGLPLESLQGGDPEAALLKSLRLTNKPNMKRAPWLEALEHRLARACRKQFGRSPKIEILVNTINGAIN